MRVSDLTRLICTPWAGVNDLPENRPDVPEADYEDLLWQASETLYAFSGRQFGGPCESAAVVPARHGRLDPDVFAASQVAGSSARVWAARRDDAVLLPGAPVTAVTSVVDAAGEPLEGWDPVLPVGRVHFTGDWPAGAVITYTHGLAPPIGGKRSAVLLAVEIAKAWVGDRNCKLPRRIESVAREGVTVSLLNTFQSLDQQKTGLWEVDAWLASCNPHRLIGRPTVWSPDRPRARRRNP